MSPEAAYVALLTELREVALLGSIGSLLDCDEHPQMPDKAGEHRAAQASLMAKLSHERFTSPRVGELLATVEGSDLVRDADSDPAVNVREARRAYNRETKLPTTLVEELTKTAVLGQQAWGEAKKANDFPKFRPWLEKTLELKRQEAACVGSKSGEAYDALLDPYEPGETAAGIRRTFESLRAPLVE